MARFKSFWGSVSLLAATTIGAGMFSLPYIFKESGWLPGIFYIVVLSGAVIFVHYLYWLALARVDEKKRLLGLVRAQLGNAAFYAALISIVVGLLLTLVIYLILAQNFGKMILPAPLNNFGAVLFWLTVSLPLLLRLPRLVGAEFLATTFKVLIILLVFLMSKDGFSAAPALKLENIFLPFGALLFSLAGWTAIEPMFDWQKRNGDSKPLSKLTFGTFFSAAVYLFFIIGVLGSDGIVSPDVFTGHSSWPLWELQIFALLGILAIWTPYVPVSLEIKNELEKDLRVPVLLSFGAVLILPPVIFFSGFFNFLSIISLVGGVFLALQYVFIILVSKKILALSGAKKFFANLLLFVFAAAAAYEIYYFAAK